MLATSDIVLECQDLVKHYTIGSGLFSNAARVHALDGVTLQLRRGETLAVVGESGCGKSTLARCLMRLDEPTSGTIRLAREDISHLGGSAIRALRRKLQIVFQDPYASLNPRRTIFQTIADPLRIHGIAKGRARGERVKELLRTVSLGEEFMSRYPHELSGGQRQRVAIARALAVDPDAIICDEPVSALDVSIQAQVINLLKRLQLDRQLSYLFISHDLSLVMHISDRIAVMYLGQVVELADRSDLAQGALHPYSKALFSAAPIPDPDAAAARKRTVLSGDLPSPVNPPSGCRFQGRCPYVQSRCVEQGPELRRVGDRLVRCHFAEEINAGLLTQTSDGAVLVQDT